MSITLAGNADARLVVLREATLNAMANRFPELNRRHAGRRYVIAGLAACAVAYLVHNQYAAQVDALFGKLSPPRLTFVCCFAHLKSNIISLFLH